MNARSLALLMALSLLVAIVPAEAQSTVSAAPTYAGYSKRAELKIAPGKGALVALKVAGDVLAECAPDLADLRVLDAQGREIPYAVEMPPAPAMASGAGSARAMAYVSATSQRSGTAAGDDTGVTETYELAPPPKTTAHAPVALFLDVARPHFVRQVAFGVKGAGAAARGHTSIFRISNGTAENTRIVIPASMASLGKPLVLELSGTDSMALEPVFSWVESAPPPRDERLVLPLGVAESTAARVTTLVIARAPGVVPSTLRFAASTARFQRTVRVFDGAGLANGARLAEGLLLRTGAPGEEVLDLNVGPSKGRSFRIEIDNEDSPPLAALAVSALVAQPTLVFSVPANTVGVTLRFGGGHARRPRYDITGLVRAPGVAVRAADVMNVGANDTGALRAAGTWPAVPAAVVDARRYGYTKSFVVGAGGASSGAVVSRIPLGVAELSVLRTDRGDVRIVDSKRQSWPYVLAESEKLTSLPVALAGPKGAVAQQSRFEIAMPASPMIVQFLVLESRDLQLVRPYALAGLGPGGAQRFELHGTLTRDLDPLDDDASGDFVARIPLPAVPIAALQLDVQNGDNVPPAFERTRLLSRTAELVSPLPAGTYELLLERRDEAPPVYDLASSREALLAYERRDVTFVTGFGPNTAFRPMLAQPGPGAVPPWLLWSSLITAILVLGAITLRHSSADAEPGGPHA